MIATSARPPRRWPVLSTLRARLTAWYVGLLALILAAFSAFLFLSLAGALYSEIDRSLEDHAQRVIAPIQTRGIRPPLGPPSDLPRPRPRIAGTVVHVYDAQGDAFILGDAWDGRQAAEDARLAATDTGRDIRTVVLPDGEPWRVLSVAVERAGDRVAVVQIARSEEDARATLGFLLVGVALAVPLTLLVAVAVGLFLAGRALDPIDRITRTADQIEAENLARRLNLPNNGDEVGRLAATFDHMLDRLEQAFRRQRQFTADASHELRTPLAMLISQADVALERRRSAADYRQALVSIRDDARRMDQLLGDLLTLARADAGQQLLMTESLDLADLVMTTIAAMAPLASTGGVAVEPGTVERAVVEGDQTRLVQLLVNLVDNAIKYTPAGGTVTLSVERLGQQAHLRVADTGIGIAAEHLPHLFERFYRVDEARARADGGAGLGLTIARWIVEAHGGAIHVESEPGRGSTFTVELPLAIDAPRPHADQAQEPRRALGSIGVAPPRTSQPTAASAE